ncbi:hypothetical protein MEU_00391 [Candida albicans P37005]|nr:hypothetical protein MEU_00391 [Candida albicans P37005]
MKFSLTLLTATIATIVAAAPAQYTGQAIDSNQVVEIPESAVEAYFPIEDELTPVFGEIDNKPVILIVNGTTLTSGANNEKREAKSKGGFRLTNFGYFEPGKRDANADVGFRLTNFGYFEPGKRDANAEAGFRLTNFGYFEPGK